MASRCRADVGGVSVEVLEPRRLLTFSAGVNFQPAAVAGAAGYLVDAGQVFGGRGNGYSYGWNADNSANVRQRAATSADRRFDTLAMMQHGGTFAWEIAVPNGTYRVHVVAGDSAFATSTVRINVENKVAAWGTGTPMRPWVEGWQTVAVADGRLTLSPGAGAVETKIDFVEITDDLAAPIVPVVMPVVARPVTLGINLDGMADYATVSPFIDLATQFRRWAPVDKPWKPDDAIPRNADNYPTADAAAITFATGFPSGAYQVSYRGTGDVAFARYHNVEGVNLKIDDLAFTPVAQADGRKAGTVTLEIPAKVEDWYFALVLTNVDANDPVRDLHIVSPDADYGVSDTFRPVFLQKVAAFDGPLRVMDWMMTNSSPVKRWEDRTAVTRFSYVTPNGVPYEQWIKLANALHKDLWVNVPHEANGVYIQNLAALLRDTLDPGLKVYVEYSNEAWNSSSPQGQYLYNLAANDPSTSGDVVSRAAQEMGRQTAKVASYFRAAFGDARYAAQVRPMIGGFIANPSWAQNALDYIKAKVGEPRDYVAGVAIAPYVGNESDMGAINDADLTLDALFAWMNDRIDTTVDSWIRAHKAITDRYEVGLTAYEGGQHLQALAFEGNEAVKRAAQDDPRMAEVYRHLITKWVADGGGEFEAFSLATKNSKFGYWGLLQAIDEPTSVKYAAVTGMVGTVVSVVDSGEVVVPGKPTARPVAKRPVAVVPPVRKKVFAGKKRVGRVFD